MRAALRAASSCIGLAALLVGSGGWAQPDPRSRSRGADEIAPFRLTGIDGYVLTRYLRDDNAARQPASGGAAGAESRQRLSSMRQEVFVMTHSYVYLPSLLSLDIGGGPILDSSSYTSDGRATKSAKPLYNLTGRATVLRDKPYRGGLFYEHLNPTQSVGPAQVMLTENTRYGLDFSLLNPVTPVPLHADASRSRTQGKSTEQTIDDRIDQFRLRADGRIGTLGSTQFRFQSVRQESRSGSTGLPIQASRSNSDLVNLDTRMKFGANREYDLSNFVTFNTQKYSASQGAIGDNRDLRFSLDLRGRHSDALQTYARYSLNNSEMIDQKATLNSLGAGLNYRVNPALTTTLGARGDFNKTTQLTSSLTGINASSVYRKGLPVGEATASYGFSYTTYDQKVSDVQARVVGERLTLAGSTLVALVRPQVFAGTVVVSNLTRTQTFVEGVDYVLSVIGLNTRIQRLIGGNILDGQEVLVDYAYDVGGTYALNQIDHTVNLNWGLKNVLNAYLRFQDSAPHLTSGTPTFQLNPVRSTLAGARADVPLTLLPDLLVGGYLEREDRREVISPSRRAAYEAYAQLGLPIGRGNVRFGTRRTQVDYDSNPSQGVNLTAYDLRFWSRLPNGMEVSFDAGRERDTGAPTARQRTFATARAQWRLRRFQMTFDLQRIRETQGASDRNLTRANLMMRRDF